MGQGLQNRGGDGGVPDGRRGRLLVSTSRVDPTNEVRGWLVLASGNSGRAHRIRDRGWPGGLGGDLGASGPATAGGETTDGPGDA